MKLIAWNCRGLGNHRAVQELVDIVQAQGPIIVFLSKTWSGRERMEWVRSQLKLDGRFIVPSIGWGGGLALLWKNKDMVWVDNFSNFHIDAIMHGGSENAWRLIGFYGEPETCRRNEGWNMLRMLSTKLKLLWCCFVDFNELLEVADKKGGAPRSHNLMQAFQEALDDCGFIDLGFLGPECTWHGKRRGELVWERLDRRVANYEWLNRFPTGRVHHLHCFTSDHRPLLLALDPNGESHKWRRKPFRFEAMWLMDPGCGEMVSRAWAHQTEGTPMFQVTQKLRKCKKMLKKWSRAHFGNVKQQIKQTKEKLWQAEVASARDGKDDEQMWHQRSRLQWIQSGDRNTQFFHGTATQRKRKNFIKGLRDSEGRWQTEEGIYTKILVDLYADLFTTSNPQNLNSIMEGVQEVVTEEMNAKLTAMFTVEEVESAIKEMAPLKVPGPDGLPPLFY